MGNQETEEAEQQVEWAIGLSLIFLYYFEPSFFLIISSNNHLISMVLIHTKYVFLIFLQIINYSFPLSNFVFFLYK